jgi:hypothetical protein
MQAISMAALMEMGIQLTDTALGCGYTGDNDQPPAVALASNRVAFLLFLLPGGWSSVVGRPRLGSA